jgi:uncharacterized protein (TIGR02145 family)
MRNNLSSHSVNSQILRNKYNRHLVKNLCMNVLSVLVISVQTILAATLALALAFSFSCSGGDPDDNGGGWNSGGNGTDDYGFSALPGGRGHSDGYFGGYSYSYGLFLSVGTHGLWWSSTEEDASFAYGRRMRYSDAYVIRSNGSYVVRASDDTPSLYSVRCVQD